MIAFIDTSSLFKKYVQEEGSEAFETLLDTISEIVVSPTTLIEVHSILERRLREKTITAADAKWIEKQFNRDYVFFSVVQWTNDLVGESIRLVRKHQLRIFDTIQLASASLAAADMFITSDKRLYETALKEFGKVKII